MNCTNTVAIILNQQELEDLLRVLDAAVRFGGLAMSRPVAELEAKVREAVVAYNSGESEAVFSVAVDAKVNAELLARSSLTTNKE
jgi:hypothetical protein